MKIRSYLKRKGTMSRNEPSVSVLHFKFDGFEDLMNEVGAAVSSGVKTDCNGNSWEMEIYPGGYDSAASDGGYCSVAIALRGGDGVRAMRTCIIRNSDGRVAIELGNSNTRTRGFIINRWRRQNNFVKRSLAADCLLEGALHIDFMVQYRPEAPNDYYVPPNPFAANMLALLEGGESADVSFKVGNVIIPAHMLFLKTNAPILARQAKENPTSINGTTPEAFQHLLRYIYGGNLPDPSEMLNIGRHIIDIADRYGITGLKIAVENTLVSSCVLTLSNVEDYLLLSHAKRCPLLKEYATSFFVSRAKDIMNSRYSKKLKESPQLQQELILATAESSWGANSSNNGMSVSELRKALAKRGLDVDGTKEILVSRLEHSNKRQRTE